MKGVVLDTHIWLWYRAGNTRLSPQVAELLSQSSLDIRLLSQLRSTDSSLPRHFSSRSLSLRRMHHYRN